MHQEMTYDEREALKSFSREGKNLEEALIMIAHWMRQETKIQFSEYAANWAAAHQERDVTAMREKWPLVGPRKIADNGSDWVG